MKKGQNGNGQKQPVSMPARNIPKKTIPVKVPLTPKKKRLRILAIVSVVFLLLLYFVANSTDIEGLRIIHRAKQQVKLYVPDSQAQLRGLLEEALDKMTIIYPGDSDKLNLDSNKTFFLCIVPGEKMSGSTSQKIELMVFHSAAFETRGKIVVLMNALIGYISNDMDAKASALVHELIHGIQASGHRINHETMNQKMYFADELAAWNCQYFLYQKARPDMFTGLTCDCKTETIYGESDAQKKVLEGDDWDRLVRSIVLFSMCKESYILRYYDKQKNNFISVFPNSRL